MHSSRDEAIGLDADGILIERVSVDGTTVVVHHDDIPESDITVLHGLRVTTPIRTVIDIASELQPDELMTVMDDCLTRGLFTVEDMTRRLAEPDLSGRAGATRVRVLVSEHCAEFERLQRESGAS